jgi:predicted NUDIX family phosphoesterase
MDRDERPIMVVERRILLGDGAFQGFLPADRLDYEARIRANARYLPRGRAEGDPAFKQPIAYAVVANPATGGVFAYQRSSAAADYDEGRLRGRWSWGVGGHIEAADGRGDRPIRASLEREIREEVAIEGDLAFTVLGYINDDLTPVGAVHFGILYLAETDAATALPRSPEIARGGFRPVEELAAIVDDPACTVESWSAIALPPLLASLARIR